MKTIKLFSTLVLSLLLQNSIAQDKPANTLSLKQCIETGIANNLLVQQTNLQMQTAQVNYNQAKMNMLPNLNAAANHGINQGRSIDPFSNSYINQQINFASYGISSSVTLFNGFSLQNAVKQNALAYEASKMDLQQAKDNLTINIILAYLQVLSTEDLLTQANNQYSLSKKQVDRLEVLNQQGAVAPPVLSDLKGQLANDELNIISTKNNLETAKITLCQLLNMPYDKNMQLERLDAESYAVKYEDDAETVYNKSIGQFAMIKAFDLRRQSAVKAVKATKGELFPILSLSGNANTNYSSAAQQFSLLNSSYAASDDYVNVNGNNLPVMKRNDVYKSDKIKYATQIDNNLFSSVSLNLRIPIFNSMQTRNRVKLAKIQLKNTELASSNAKIQLKQFIEQAYVNMTSAAERYKTLLDQVSAFNQSFKAAEVRFNEGVGTTIDYLTAKNNLDRSNNNLVIAKYDYVLRTRILDYYEGKNLW